MNELRVGTKVTFDNGKREGFIVRKRSLMGFYLVSNSWRLSEREWTVSTYERDIEKVAKGVSYKEAVKRAQELLLRAKECSGSNGVWVHLKKGRLPDRFETGPCHSGVMGRGSNRSLAIVTLIDRNESLGQKRLKKRQLYDYYDFLINRSPWSHCFEPISGEKAFKAGSCVLKVDVPANMLQGALISTRNSWEYALNIEIWWELVQLGVEERLAFIACYLVSRDGDGVVPTDFRRDHIAIAPGSMDKQGVEAFLSGTPLFERGVYTSGDRSDGVIRAFEGEGTRIYSDFVREFDDWGTETSGVVMNPFAKAKPRTSNRKTMRMADYAEFVQHFFQKLINE